MAKIVIAGVANCPYFARVELLADRLALNLPEFKLHKIVKLPEEWEEWLATECQKRGWQHTKSPLIWRELVNRGGKGMLIGGANEFQEYAQGYYGIMSDLNSGDMINVAKENFAHKNEVDQEEHNRIAAIKPLRICITNAASVVAYGVIGALVRGGVLGPGTDIALDLYDNKLSASALQGVAMEIEDLALAHVREIQVVTFLDQTLEECKILIILDEVLKDSDETAEEWLQRNHEHFLSYSEALEKLQNPDMKVIISGCGPVNFIASMMLRFAPSILPANLIAVPWLVENRAKGVLAERLKVNSALITDLLVWGSVNGMHVLDVSKGKIYDYDGAIWGPHPFSVSLKDMVHDDSWLETKFTALVDERLSVIEASLGHPAAMAAGDGIASLLKQWWLGSNTGEMHSLAVASQGWYGVPEGLVFSFPVQFTQPGAYKVVSDLELTEELISKIEDLVEELEIEVEAIFPNPDRKPRKGIELILTEPEQPLSETQELHLNGDSTGGTEDIEIQAADLEEEKIQPLDKILEDDEDDVFNQTRKKENERNARNEEEEEADEEEEEAEEEQEEEEEGAEAISIM